MISKCLLCMLVRCRCMSGYAPWLLSSWTKAAHCRETTVMSRSGVFYLTRCVCSPTRNLLTCGLCNPASIRSKSGSFIYMTDSSLVMALLCTACVQTQDTTTRAHTPCCSAMSKHQPTGKDSDTAGSRLDTVMTSWVRLPDDDLTQMHANVYAVMRLRWRAWTTLGSLLCAC